MNRTRSQTNNTSSESWLAIKIGVCVDLETFLGIYKKINQRYYWADYANCGDLRGDFVAGPCPVGLLIYHEITRCVDMPTIAASLKYLGSCLTVVEGGRGNLWLMWLFVI